MNGRSDEPSPVYRSARGREAVLAAYRAQASRVPFAFESKLVPTRFGATHIVLGGAQGSPPLVVLSGVHFGAFFTTEWVAPLATRFRLILPDVVGQPNLSAETRPEPSGHQYARWLVDVLEQLDVGPARMMGISFGGAVLLDVATFSPARVSRAALLVPGGFAGGSLLSIVRRLFLPWAVYRLLPRPARVPRIVSPLGDNLPEHWYAFFDLLLRHVHWAVQPPGPFGIEQLAHYKAPTLAVFARDDCFFPGEQAAAAAERALGASVTTRLIAGKHMPSATEMQAVQRELLAFLGGA